MTEEIQTCGVIVATFPTRPSMKCGGKAEFVCRTPGAEDFPVCTGHSPNCSGTLVEVE